VILQTIHHDFLTALKIISHVDWIADMANPYK